MKVGIPREVHDGEKRVAATPDSIKRLKKLGFEVMVETGAGVGAQLPDQAFVDAGAEIAPDAATLWAQADIVAKVRPPEADADGLHECARMRRGQVIVSLLFPAQNDDLVRKMAATGCTAIALDQIPRISRAQKMDVLSSMANIAGYRAVIEAANQFGSFFGGQITAAGKTRPAQVLVIGAGVAGLAAIAAARGLGAQVRAFDVRLAAKEQCESLGARFLELEFPADESGETAGGYAKTMSKEFIDAEMALFLQQAKEVDIIITTALIPGKPAPKLIDEEMVKAMRPGSVVVDLAAEQGGNCACTVPGEAVEAHGVTVIGYTDLTSRLATHASQFFGTNIAHLLDDMGGAEGFHVDLDDEVVLMSLVLHEGRVTWPPPPEARTAIAPKTPQPAPPPKAASKGDGAIAAAGARAEARGGGRLVGGLVAAALLLVVGVFAPPDFVQHFTVFVLACFIGWQVIWNVTPALHTPLMSVTNAISGIIVVGGILQAATGDLGGAAILGAVAVLVATINIAGGFLVTRRMLAMFRKEG
jgi:NAD(P) transhydrogenase subunit alpha